jgi:hypothetical protein
MMEQVINSIIAKINNKKTTTPVTIYAILFLLSVESFVFEADVETLIFIIIINIYYNKKYLLLFF